MEIIYRVWCSNDVNPKGRMYYAGDIVESGVGYRDRESQFMLDMWGQLYQPPLYTRDKLGFVGAGVSNNGIVKMLSTHRIDKNGVTIYDRDIIKFHYFYGSGGLDGFVEAEHELTGTVEWGNYGWGVSAINGEHWCGYTGYKNGEGSSNFLDLMAMNESGLHEESFEVIGNIHENADLLK